MMRVRMASNSSVFANRGDPWVSDREGLHDYGRNGFDDPERDQYKAKHAVLHEETIGRAGVGKFAKPTERRRIQNIAIGLNLELARIERERHGR
jgi:hypothetical protein